MTEQGTTPARRLDELTLLYERHAYVAWNIALRTTLAEDAADGAARRAFVGQVAHPDPNRLALDVARLAVDAAGAVDPRSIEQPVLSATAHLAAVQRAVLALAELTDLPQAAVAAKLGVDAEREQRLRDGAHEQLGLLLGVTSTEARTGYADLPWDAPPPELWQRLYPELHAAVTEQAHAAAGPVPAAAGPVEAMRRRPGRRLRSGALAGVATLAIAGVAWAAGAGGGGSDGGTEAAQDSTALPGVSGGSAYSSDASGDNGDVAGAEARAGGGQEDSAGDSATKLLTPEELDRLRREEIERLKELTSRQADRRLPQQARDRAARGVDDLVKLARARQRAAERRELALRRQLAREREARARERGRNEQREQRPAPAGQGEQPTEDNDADGRKKGGKGDSDGGRVEAECLYDPNNGTYICPE